MNPSTVRTLVACLGLAAAAALAATPDPGADLVQLNFPENLEVKVLVDYVGQRLGLNLLYDEAVLKKRVTIAAATKAPADSLLGLLESVLRMTGQAMVNADKGTNFGVPPQGYVSTRWFQ